MANNRLTTRIILRNDSTQGWSAVANSADYKLLKGEVGIEFVYASETDLIPSKTKLKIGDGQRTWSELPYFGGDECHVFEATVSKGGNHTAAITEAVGSTQLNKGDVAIVKEAMIDESDAELKAKLDAGTLVQNYQYTAYIYGETGNGIAWKAMDGNYSASNVYFDDDFVFTTNIGTVTGVTSSKTVDAAGKSVKQFFSGLFAAEVDGGKKTDPYASVVLKNNGTNITSDTSYEVGTTFKPSYEASFNDGEYTYGPEPTGVTVNSWAVTSTADESWSTSSGTGSDFIISDSTSYKITAVATHTDGSLALSNIGNQGSFKFVGGDNNKKTATSKTISGYRAQFYGAMVTPIDLTSDTIRALAGKVKPGNTFNGKYAGNNKNGFQITIPEGCKQVVIALYGKTLKNVFDHAAFGTDIVGSFPEVSATSAINVEGANDFEAKPYKVYVYAPDAALGANTYDVVIG